MTTPERPPTKPAPKVLTRRRRALRWFIRSVLGVLGFAALYFLAVWILGLIPVNSDYVQADEGIEIWVWDHGVHTNFVLPVKTEFIDWAAFAPLEDETLSSEQPYVLIGWGDHDFYIHTPTYDDFSLATTVKAIFLPTSAVMHMRYLSHVPMTAKKRVKLTLTKEEYQLLVTYMKNSFRLDAAGERMSIEGKGYSEFDVFYHANGTYHLFDTCNNWANTALKRTGVKTALWSPFGYAIFNHVKNR
jgi:uncharacterized protein (TIGR02117 family)